MSKSYYFTDKKVLFLRSRDKIDLLEIRTSGAFPLTETQSTQMMEYISTHKPELLK